jgi:hypothetical protein
MERPQVWGKGTMCIHTQWLSFKVSHVAFISGKFFSIFFGVNRKKILFASLLIGYVQESNHLLYRIPHSNFNLPNIVMNWEMEQKRSGKRTITSKLGSIGRILWHKRWRWRRALNRLSRACKLRSLAIITHGRERNALFHTGKTLKLIFLLTFSNYKAMARESG